MVLAALGLLTDLWHHCRDFSTRTDTRIAGEISTRSISSRSSTRTSRTRSPLDGDERRSPTEVESSCYFFWRSVKNTRLRYFQKVAFLSSFLVGTRRQPSSLPSCKTPPRKRFYNLGRSVFINMQLVASREPLSPEGLSSASSNGPLKCLDKLCRAFGKTTFPYFEGEGRGTRFLRDRSGRSYPFRAAACFGSAVNRKLRRQTLHRLRDSMVQITYDRHMRECNLLRYRWI